jgi:DNA polymerase-3 subunit delta
MKIPANRLNTALTKSPAPIYLVAGNEDLLVFEASQSIRKCAQQNNFTERLVLHVTPKFDWTSLLANANSFSLFGDKTLIELRIPNDKINEAGKKTLLEYAENPPENKILLIITQKLSGPTQNTKWYKNIEKIGVVVQVWPINYQQLPQWITQRLHQQGMTAEPAAISFLAENTEGNLLAAKQAIEKISLLYDKKNSQILSSRGLTAGSSNINDFKTLDPAVKPRDDDNPVQRKNLSLQEVVEAISDNSRYDVFSLVDAALGGDVKRTTRILIGLKEEGVEPILILWGLAREIRSLSIMAFQLSQGENLRDILYKNHVWEKRQPLVRLGLKRHNQKSLLRLLQLAAKIDRQIKGAETGNAWDALMSLSIKLCRSTPQSERGI